mgnify:CR=1 FL=1
MGSEGQGQAGQRRAREGRPAGMGCGGQVTQSETWGLPKQAAPVQNGGSRCRDWRWWAAARWQSMTAAQRKQQAYFTPRLPPCSVPP